MKSKHLLLTLLLALIVPWAAMAQTPSVTIGSGTATLQSLPSDSYYKYAIAQQIYTAEEIDASGNITSIAFYNAGSGTATNNHRKFKIYMAHTDKDKFTSATDWIALTEADLVYEAPSAVTFTSNTWTTLTLDTPFAYNGTDNLVVAVIDNTNGYVNSNHNLWRVFTTTDNQSLYKYGDGLSSLTPNGYNGTTQQSGTFSTSKNQIVLGGIQQSCAEPSNLTATLDDTDHTIATLSWTENGQATSWVLQYSEDNTFATGVQSFNISGTPSKDLTGLTPEHKYYARVRPSCSETKWSDVCTFKPTAAIPQTVCDGTAPGTTVSQNSYVPVYGNYAENYNKDEFIIPATTQGMSNMDGGTISQMTFYLSSPASDLWGNARYMVFLKEVNESSFASTSYYGTEGATIVLENAELDGTHETMTIEFTTDYVYNGGNLLVGIYETTKGTYKSAAFYGIESTSGALYKNNSTSLESITSGNLQNFIPKTTFTYVPNPTPKPKNLAVSNITSSGATLAWDAPTTATPTGYQYQYKEGEGAWTALQSTTDLSVALSLSASKTYTFQVRATYDGVGESDFVETTFTTLDDCAFPTNLVATTTPGQGTKATLTWVKGYDETAWVLEYATNNTFTEGLGEVTDGFTVEGNNVTANLTGLTAETHYYARVKANCDGPTSSPSNVVDFTPTNYVDYTINNNNTTTTYYVPFHCNYIQYGTNGQFIIPATMLTDVAGGTIRRLTFYSTTASKTWEGATFKVYMKEVENTAFATTPTEFDWDMTEVYSGILSIADNQMVIEFGNDFNYGNGNLMIGFQETTKGGTNSYLPWRVVSGFTNAAAYGYMSSATATNMTYGRSSYLPMMTFNYRPTPYVKIAAINEGTIAATSAELTWTAPETTATITGYAYQYKLSSAAEWPTAWSNLAASATSVTLQPLTPGTSYDFQIKVLYGEHESAVNSTSFFTECAIVTAFPWKEDFEAYATGDFSHPCWVNQHISGDGDKIFKVYTSANGTNSTHQLQLPDQDEGTLTKLRLPEMNLPGNNYQFVIDVYRNSSTYNDNYPYEGIRVFASTDGSIEGATELTFIPRQYNVSSTLIPEESKVGWYTYEIPIGVSGTCYIILRGESQYCTSTYMDNLTVEQIPTCARPSALAKSEVTNHSATLTWTAGDPDQHNWQVAYSKTSFDPNTANFDLTTVETVDFTTGATCTYRMDKLFDAESTYYLYIRANCGTATEPDYGPWSRKGINLTTLGASPAPSNFTASNIGSQTADLVWTAGGGDYELSWDLYYKQSDDAPTAPTEETHATKTVTTLPTTENPYTLDGLTEESRYYIWVRANHTINSVTTHSAWVALTGNYFTTLAACPTPTGLAYNNLTAVSADLTWVGSPDVDDYTVQYRTAAQIDPDNIAYQEHFTSQSLPNGWTHYSTLLTDDVLNGTTALTSTSAGWGYTTYALGEYNWKVNLYKGYSGNCQYWMVTPSIAVGANNVLTFDVALTKYNSNDAPTTYPGTSSKFFVLISSDEMATWTVLREWNNTGSNYVLNNIPNDGETISINLSAYNEKDVYIAFYGEQTESGTDNDLHIDDVVVAGSIPAGQWVTATDNVTTQSYRLNNLTGGIKYDAHVKSNCTSGEYCPEVSFTTLPEGTKVFTTAGEWGTATNWMPNNAPDINDEVIIRANATIESGCVAQAKKITFQGSPTPTLTINDGGQLQTDNTVTATVKKNITGYGAGNEEDRAGYYLIGNPLSSTIYVYNTDETYGMRTGTYDLYSWSRTNDLEWSYYGANNTYTLYMYNGSGYLYANAADVTLTFTGNVKANNIDVTVTPSYAAPTETQEFRDWNLYANPFVCNAYLNDANDNLAFYRMNPTTGADFIVATGAIAPMEGIFVQATDANQTFKFSRNQIANNSRGQLNINLSKAATRGASLADNAIIRFGEGNLLEKFCFSNNSSKVYIPMEGKDYAVVNAESNVGEIPVSFEAKKNGTYTLSFTNEEVSFAYLHLIDNMTGIETDLLANPSYTFEARTTDYASRFKLVFATGSSTGSDTFAYYSNGNWVINNEGRATLQVVDVNGRILKSESINGCANVNFKAAAGIYMIRLVNGDNVKVQKVVVR